MFKLKMMDGGIYCLLVTFDPQNQTLNIIDVKAQHDGASMEVPPAVNQLLRAPSAEVEPSKPDVGSTMPDPTQEPQVPQEPQSEAPRHKVVKKSNSSAVDVVDAGLKPHLFAEHEFSSRIP